MPKKKPYRDDTFFHAEPEKKTVVKPKIEPEDLPEYESVLWSDIAPDTFAPDKPNQELDQIMSYKNTHLKKAPSKRRKGK